MTSTTETEREFFYKPGATNILAQVINGRSGYGKETLDEIRTKENDQSIIQAPESVVFKSITEALTKVYIDPPSKEIDENRWWEALGELPPSRWHHTGGIEFFHISELTIANIVTWLGNKNGIYREFSHITSATDEELIAKFNNEEL